ncbi:hypothetical protein ACFVT5_04980 [Streptomyces sp. NPDC058001]|uniref:hypothetical protein n=1 Tax=Streptomyces sp. NPDC058001 TaxID=3346300 RepID=UPI0036ED0E89
MTAVTSPGPVEMSAGDDLVRVRWVMPEGFFELPLDVETIEELGDQLLDLAARVLSEADFELQAQWAAMCAASYDFLVDAGVQYAGFVITEVDEVRCTANVQISLMDLPPQAAPDPVGILASALRDLDTGEVTEVRLPCGPAVTCVGARQATVDGSLSESGSDEPFWTSFIQVQVPLPNATVVVLEMTTPTQEGWDVFSSMFAGIVKSLRLYDVEGAPVKAA